MIITGKTDVKIEISDKDIGRAVMARALEMAGVDDPGCDYYTDARGHVFMGRHCICYSPKLAAMVDTANYLIYGRRLQLDEDYPPPPDLFPPGWPRPEADDWSDLFK